MPGVQGHSIEARSSDFPHAQRGRPMVVFSGVRMPSLSGDNIRGRVRRRTVRPTPIQVEERALPPGFWNRSSERQRVTLKEEGLPCLSAGRSCVPLFLESRHAISQGFGPQSHTEDRTPFRSFPPRMHASVSRSPGKGEAEPPSFRVERRSRVRPHLGRCRPLRVKP